MIPAAATSWNAACGLDAQLKICIGNVVNGSITDSGTNATYVNAPIIISGAVSPIALDIDKITPVNIPGVAMGKTWCLIVWNLVAPTAYAPTVSYTHLTLPTIYSV